MPDEKPKELDIEPEVRLFQWPSAAEGQPQNRNWGIIIMPHEKGRVGITTPKVAYDIVPMSKEELEYLMAAVETLPALFAMLLGLHEGKEQ